MKPYSFLRNDWDGSPKTVWSRKKQDKLFNILITKYPTAKELRKKLLDIGTEESYNLGKYINPNWNNDQYYRFITSNVIKYSDNGKIILSQLVGASIGTVAWLGTSKYLEKGLSDYDRALADLNKDETLKIVSKNPGIAADIIRAEKAANSVGYTSSNKLLPFMTGLGVKGLASYGTYKFLNKLDKEKSA